MSQTVSPATSPQFPFVGELREDQCTWVLALPGLWWVGLASVSDPSPWEMQDPLS